MIKSLAVLMTCHNRVDTTISCLESLFVSLSLASSKVEPVVFLVDDGSTDGTSATVLSRFPNVNVIQGTGNLFWGHGMNESWREASKNRFDFYLWLNDDTLLKSNAINDLVCDSEAVGGASLIAGICESSELKGIVTYSGYRIKDRERIVPLGNPVECDYFNGNLVLIPHCVFEQVGFIDSAFHHSFGDVDYGLRAKRFNIKSYVSSSILGICNRHESLPKWCNPNYPLSERFKSFGTPLAKNPKEVFLFESRHSSLLHAVFRSSIVYVRLLFPSVWIKLGIAKI